MTLDIGYYFEHLEKFPLPDFLSGLSWPAEILEKARATLDGTLARLNPSRAPDDGVRVYGACHIGEGTAIYNGATIIGPVYIGKNCEIMPGATIRPYSIIGDGCKIGSGSELKRAVLFGGAKVASLAFVGDSVLGASARIGSGTITANRRFDQAAISVKLDGERHDLGSAFFGLILGDSSRLGANCVSQPGTHIGPYTWVMPMTNVRGAIAREKRVYTKSELVFDENAPTELKP
jgi:bifunctional UDP-N-acetylglucosamine pyrophosphorylase/glucosamine-1-phosphate N-acetyltransferase